MRKQDLDKMFAKATVSNKSESKVDENAKIADPKAFQRAYEKYCIKQMQNENNVYVEGELDNNFKGEIDLNAKRANHEDFQLAYLKYCSRNNEKEQ